MKKRAGRSSASPKFDAESKEHSQKYEEQERRYCFPQRSRKPKEERREGIKKWSVLGQGHGLRPGRPVSRLNSLNSCDLYPHDKISTDCIARPKLISETCFLGTWSYGY